MQDNQQLNDPASTRALRIPEILQTVGDRFYLALDSTDSKWASDNDKIISLVAFIQVSRLWFRTFHPILWYAYSPITMLHFTQESLLANTPHLRIVHIFGELSQHLGCNHLVTLELLKSYTYRKTTDLPMERELVRTNPGLKTLVWEGPQTSNFLALQKEDFAELVCLRELVLSRWSSNNTPFIEVLRPMAIALRILDLRHVREFSVGNLMDPNDPTSTLVTLPQLETILIGTYRYEYARLILPSMIRELVVASPNLTTLGLKLHQVDDYHEARVLARSLRKHCPKLKDLTIHCVHNHLLEESATIATAVEFIRECSASGLSRITVWDAPWHDNDFFLAIIAQARTLTDLEISWAVEGYIGEDTLAGAGRVLQLLTQCRQLKRFMVSDVPLGSLADAFKLWRSQQWGCLELESFGMKFDWSGEDDDVDGSDGDDYDDEVESISGTNPVMGWYLHGNEGKLPMFSGVVRELFRMLQPLQHIKTLVADKLEYTRSSIPPVRQPDRFIL
ncbi:MAG: hypothetical protein J3R72DRAFT_422259 [Linnemannia gamsii]|nr:MAG: hypothetical protein J3R72DRAFT_422259 [Linnemannia gamsii]